MSTNYAVLFYLKKPKNYTNGPMPVYMRITVDGIPKELSTGKACEPSRWSSQANRVVGKTEESKLLNAYFDTLENQLADIHLQMTKLRLEITAQLLKLKLQGKEVDNRKYLLVEFEDHNAKMKALIGKGFTLNTLKGYKTSINHIQLYIEKEYKMKDIELEKIDHTFITGFEFYLRSLKDCSAITTARYMKSLRKIINNALAHRWITENPFARYKNRARPKEREFLTADELQRIKDKDLTIRRIRNVRDIFVFCCYTGLSYIDVQQLKKTDIAKGVDGKLWILTSREKSDINSNIPLLPDALTIIERYADYPPSVAKGLALPVLSNQKMNSYLKEIADLCEIPKVLTFHMSRHTFATTVTLSNNVPIETVSKMLGHTNLKTTQHYAKLLDTRVSSDMALLQQRLT
jgi:integrase